MEPYFNYDGDLQMVAYLVIVVGTLAVAIPVGLLLIRRLNETWLDADWRAARGERGQNGKKPLNNR